MVVSHDRFEDISDLNAPSSFTSLQSHLSAPRPSVGVSAN